ncbi:MAG: ABC transporter ATP-binding protein [Actinobacteria bacterium]|nr:ABC transporter ATP-binding protein [Actinomycetota bacterium]
MAIIEVENLTKKFGNVLAVDNISFSIPEGEVFGFLGPNGAGKTTTIRILSTLISPTSGRVLIYNAEPKTNGRYIRSIIGLLTETPGLYEKISAYDNLYFFSSFYDISNEKRRQNIEKFMKMFGLWDRRNDIVATYSKGMKQKLALARALIHEPKILFLDEPTAGLDPESAYMVRNFIEDLKKESTTIILCTHNLQEASTLCDRVCILKTRIVKIATLEELQKGKDTKEVEIVFANNPLRFRSLLNSIEEVINQKVEDNKIKLLLKNTNTEKTNPKIIRKLIEEGAEIVYFNEVKTNLEEIYLSLIGNLES